MTEQTNQDDDPYKSEYPSDSKVDPDIQKLIRHYYAQVDTKGKHVKYSECWAEDGVLVVPFGKEFPGRDAIRALHEGMWDGVPKRIHRPKKSFPFGNNASEVAIIGTVEYWPDDGPYVKKDMAAVSRYQKNERTGNVEMSRLQVWLTS